MFTPHLMKYSLQYKTWTMAQRLAICNNIITSIFIVCNGCVMHIDPIDIHFKNEKHINRLWYWYILKLLRRYVFFFLLFLQAKKTCCPNNLKHNKQRLCKVLNEKTVTQPPAIVYIDFNKPILMRRYYDWLSKFHIHAMTLNDTVNINPMWRD